MSAAEAADPSPGQTPPPGVVIPMFKRRPTTTSAPASADNAATELPPAAQQLAETVEAFFKSHGMTLTDDEAVRVYDVTLDLVRMMHEGALANGVLTGEQLTQLAAMVAGMRNAPQLL